MILLDRLINLLLYLSLLVLDLVCLAIICALPAIIIWAVCTCFIKDSYAKNFLNLTFIFLALKSIHKAFIKKFRGE